MKKHYPRQILTQILAVTGSQHLPAAIAGLRGQGPVAALLACVLGSRRHPLWFWQRKVAVRVGKTDDHGAEETGDSLKKLGSANGHRR